MRTQVPYTDHQPFGSGDTFADNPEPRCPCLLLLDTSGSMAGAPLAELNAGIATLKQELMADSLAMKRVEIGLITFGPVQVISPFETADTWAPPHLATTGDTPMGQAIVDGIGLIEQRKKAYQANGVSYYRPWLFLITDGAPTDPWQHAATLVRQAVDAKKLAFFAVGVDGADMRTLAKISPRQPLPLKGLAFRELFKWLSNSMGAVSRSSPAQDQLLLPAPNSWSTL